MLITKWDECLWRNPIAIVPFDNKIKNKHMKPDVLKFLLLVLPFIYLSQLHAQTLKPDLQNISQWTVFNRSVVAVDENGKKAIRFNEAPGDGYMILKGIDFSNGVIEFDVKGKNVVQQSFVGFAFHGQDEKMYEAVYFRPFNFSNPDTARRHRAVQYIAMPNYPWEKLRESFPGIYEHAVDPVPDPDSWFHVKIIVAGKKISTYINDAQTPSLVVEKLNSTTSGGVGLWVGNNSGGSFANVSITSLN